MDSMQKVEWMKRVEVIGLGEVYKVGQSVESKHLHQPQISCRNNPQNQAAKRRIVLA